MLSRYFSVNTNLREFNECARIFSDSCAFARFAEIRVQSIDASRLLRHHATITNEAAGRPAAGPAVGRGVQL